ncbi:MAG: low molecular weight phosphotyrosine protein phosphatase [Ruminococcus sp.]|nr:low molecular weight phosphotyrosine protein phosphatase [Ruminococcus sp.]MBR1764714.1 low molecular weight phosphotyrosine protein phosphatase [Ruminococcus sp.]
MVKILFVCHGNICRSPMAEFIMKDLVRQAGAEEEFFIASAATSTEEIGNPVYPPAAKELARHGLGCKGKRAVQVTRSDYGRYDLLIVMDSYNLRNLRRIIPEDPEGKIHRLLEFAGRGDDVDDPWYTRDFETAYSEIREGCEALLRHCLKN